MAAVAGNRAASEFEREDASMDMAAALPAQHSLARGAEWSAEMAASPLLSMIIPCYNEAQRIGPTWPRSSATSPVASWPTN